MKITLPAFFFTGLPARLPPAPCRLARQESEFALRLPAGLPGRSLNLRSGGASPPGAKSRSRGACLTRGALAPAPCRFTRQEPEFALRRGKPAGSEEQVTGSLSHAWRPCSGSLPVYPAGA
jgi:hypothetical protein